jgi:hypothetical protein
MSTRSRNFWVVVGVVLAIPAAAAGVLYIYSWFAPDTAKLKVFVKKAELQIPSAYREYLHGVDPSRKALVEIANAAATALQNKSSFGADRDLAAMRAFAESSPVIFRFQDPKVITVKIVNISRKLANNVKVFFPAEGFVEIAKDDAPFNAVQGKGWIELGVLEPGSQFIVTMWTTGGYLGENVRVNSDREGAANVQQWYVSRDDKRWVVGFDGLDIGFFLILAACILFLILGIISTILQRSERSDEA